MATDFSPNFPKYTCEICDIKTNNKKDYNNHLLSSKHQKKAVSQQSATKISQIADYICHKCKRKYESRSGLWRHNKKCEIPDTKSEPIMPAVSVMPDNVPDNEIKTLTNLVLELVKSNTDLQKQMMDVCKNNTIINNNSNNNNNSHNKTFNLQFFLNETCKDAMNIMDFVDSFTLQLSDLESVSQQGYVDGISNIIMKKLNEMDIHKRPIHCSDAKRDIMYVKDQDKWAKEEPGYAKLRKAIKYISKKNSDLLGQWSNAHPASKNITTQTNTEYMQMIVQAMGGRGEIGENENKIIKKIAKTVLIEK
jgi:hypothetical protein